MYPVFIVGIYCKGRVIVRENVKTQAIEARRVFAGISRLSIPRKDACALRVSCEYLMGKAFPLDTRETFCSARLYYLTHTFCTYTIYTYIT